ncbi:MAG: LysM peptidoglycan-binding domain-containing protein [Ardenticatenaceae bacterium]|nr:LysM peptidoglycan-binding domain-containing protein [Ardenticatenaceae bacterium]
MIHHREKSVIRRFDIFKLIVLLILIALLLWFWLSPPAFVQGPDEGAGETAVTDTTTPTETDTATTDAADEAEQEIATEAVEETAVPPLDVPTLDAPALANGVMAGSTALSGSGTPGSTVRVVIDGQPVGEAVVAEDGRWSLDVELAAGSHELTLEALDDVGAVANSSATSAFDVRLDVPTLNLPAAGSFAGPVTLSGTGTPGSEVAIVVDDEVVGTTTVGEDGMWLFDTELSAGNHGIHVQALDAAGNVANESEGFGLALAEVTPPAFDEASYEAAPGVVDFSGVGTPGSTVELVANGAVVGTAVVAADGTWTIPATLEAGDYDLSLRMLATDGTLLDETAGVSATVAAEESEAAATAEFVPPTLDLPEGGLMGGDITLSGTGTPGAEVAVLVNGEVVGTAVVGEDGTWSFPTTLSAGEYELTLQAVDGSGTAVTIEPVSLTLADAAATAAEESSTDEPETAVAPLPADFCKDAAPGIDQGDTYVVGVCEWLTKIANRLGIPYADLIGVNPQIANPNLIYPGQVINLPPR